MTQRLANKRLIVTGASTGIGRACVQHFVEEGARVVILDVNDEGGHGVVHQLNSMRENSANYGHCDVTDEQSVRGAVEVSVRWLGGLDGIMLHAGAQRSGSIDSFAEADLDVLLAVNVKGVFFGAKYAIPYLKVQGGTIVSTASLAGKRGGPGLTAYSATKGAVIAFTFAAAQELAPSNIRVNCVCPGWIDTPFNQPAIDFMGGLEAQKQAVHQVVPMDRQGTPDELVGIYTFLLSDDSSYVTAQAISVDGGVA